MSPEKIDELAKIVWDFGLMHHHLKKADTIIVFGSYNPIVAEQAAKVFLEGFAPVIVFSGGRSRATANWEKTEAETLAEVAISLGVPKDKILLETQATNSGENTQFSRELLAKNGIEPKVVIIVQKPYVERRTYATVKKQWPEVDVILTSPEISYEEYMTTVLDKDRTINTMVGDLWRLKAYADSGFQIPQDIPENVWKAGEGLVQAGYSKSLPNS